jgi:hypothetical protein
MNRVDEQLPVKSGMEVRGQINSLGFPQSAGGSVMSAAARSSLVNRTHRVVRERARSMNARRSLVRSLWFPMVVCSAMLVILCWTVWTVFAQYEEVPRGLPESGDQSFVLVLWFLPISLSLLAAVWFRRARNGSGEDRTR